MGKKKKPARKFILMIEKEEKPEYVSRLKELIKKNPNLNEEDLKKILVLMKKGRGEELPGNEVAEVIDEIEKLSKDWREGAFFGSKTEDEKLRGNIMLGEIRKLNEISSIAADMLDKIYKINKMSFGALKLQLPEEVSMRMIESFATLLSLADRETVHRYIQKFGTQEVKKLWESIITKHGEIPLEEALNEERLVKSLKGKLAEIEEKLNKGKSVSEEELLRELGNLNILPGEDMRIIKSYELEKRFNKVVNLLKKGKERNLGYFA